MNTARRIQKWDRYFDRKQTEAYLAHLDLVQLRLHPYSEPDSLWEFIKQAWRTIIIRIRERS